MTCRKTPDFYLYPLIEGRWWMAGSPDHFKRVEHRAGMLDLAYAVRYPWELVPIHQLPGARKSSYGQVRLQPGQAAGWDEGDTYLTGCPKRDWQGHGSETVIDRRALAEYRREIERLEDQRDNMTLGDPVMRALVEEQIKDIQDEIAASFTPQGTLRRLRNGDPVYMAYDATRQRRYRLISHLRGEGLEFLADFMKGAYSVYRNGVFYRPGSPVVVWQLKRE